MEAIPHTIGSKAPLMSPSTALCENLNLQTQSSFRLLVVRLGAMGDILHALPAITALRQVHPEWHIGWVVEPRWQPLLSAEDHLSSSAPVRGSAMPVVNQLHFAAMRDWKRHPLGPHTASAIKALRTELRAANYDAVLDLQGAIRSAVIGRMTRCTRRIGEAHPCEWPAQWLFTERIVTRGAHVIEQDVELASAVAGDTLAPAEPVLPFDANAERWCYAQLAPPIARGAARPIALIAPGAGWGAKRWPPERYASVAQGLAERGMRVLVNIGPGEESLAAPVVATGAATALNASLPQLIALTRRIALCIAGDTGPIHLASAMGRPVVGIYGPTDPSRNGPFGTHARVLRSPGSRRDHSRRTDPDPGLLTITSDDVLSAVDELVTEERAQ
jgi:heptosyltransferase-1